MRGAARAMLAVLLAAAAVSSLPAAAAPSKAGAQPPKFSAAEMLRLAEIAIAKGDLVTARAIHVALTNDPDPDIRAEARFRHAKSLASQNRNREAAILLRRIVDERPEATAVRLELARLLQLVGDSDSALRELRAAQSAGLPRDVARMVDRFSDALRESRPVGASMEVAVAPDSNINRATRSDTLGTIFGDFDIDQDSKARSGIGVSARGQAFRRFALGSGESSILVRLSGLADVYGKSSFNDLAIDLAAGPEFRIGKGRVNVEVGASARWFGQEPFTRSARLAASIAHPLGPRTQARASASASLIDNRLNDLQDGKVYSAQVGIERALSPTTGIAFSLGYDRQSLQDPGYSTTGWRARLVAWRDIGRSTLTASAELGKLEADERLLLFPQKRVETHKRLSLGATLRQISFGGFAPVVRVTRERNRSTIDFHDYKRTRTEFAITRAF